MTSLLLNFFFAGGAFTTKYPKALLFPLNLKSFGFLVNLSLYFERIKSHNA
jgi:hypothetical protein